MKEILFQYNTTQIVFVLTNNSDDSYFFNLQYNVDTEMTYHEQHDAPQYSTLSAPSGYTAHSTLGPVDNYQLTFIKIYFWQI